LAKLLRERTLPSYVTATAQMEKDCNAAKIAGPRVEEKEGREGTGIIVKRWKAENQKGGRKVFRCRTRPNIKGFRR